MGKKGKKGGWFIGEGRFMGECEGVVVVGVEGKGLVDWWGLGLIRWGILVEWWGEWGVWVR